MQRIVDRFQFLIGRLITIFLRPPTALTALFQFLIGRLITSNNGYTGELEMAFQFLIGRLITLLLVQVFRCLFDRFNSS